MVMLVTRTSCRNSGRLAGWHCGRRWSAVQIKHQVGIMLRVKNWNFEVQETRQRR